MPGTTDLQYLLEASEDESEDEEEEEEEVEKGYQGSILASCLLSDKRSGFAAEPEPACELGRAPWPGGRLRRVVRRFRLPAAAESDLSSATFDSGPLTLDPPPVHSPPPAPPTPPPPAPLPPPPSDEINWGSVLSLGSQPDMELLPCDPAPPTPHWPLPPLSADDVLRSVPERRDDLSPPPADTGLPAGASSFWAAMLPDE
ncbi:hypothetical protein FJT64_019365 [Amphibalanus amphitrite]|uniref:Uncharacterized protein n=1 Tax=Amphibalanus amphitrite TaxID=1232801 RepID=A0A6A4WWB8_AMPAM|nr:hypothetical protein FJT64_019365 [Amphibalanus amphitrite]